MFTLFHRHYHTRYHGIYRHAKQLFVFDLVLLGVAVLMLGAGLFFFFWKPGIADLIDLTISLPSERVKSGEPVRLTVKYTNHSKFTLENPALALHLPPGFVVDRSKTPESVFSKNSTFAIQQIAPGAEGQAEVYGRLWSEPRRDARISALLSYRREKSKEPEQKISSAIISLPDSVLAAELAMASSSFPNRSLPFTYTLTNNGDAATENIALRTNPAGAVFEPALPASFALAPQEQKKITGNFKLPARGETFTAQFTPEVLVNNHPIKQLAIEKKVTLVSPAISVSARLPNPPAYVESGQTIPVEVTWQNRGNTTLRNLRLRLAFAPDIVDLQTTARENNIRADEDSIVIDSASRTNLGSAAAGVKETFTIQVRLVSSFSLAEDSGANFQVIPSIETSLPEVPGEVFSSFADTIKLPLASELKLNAEARFYTPEGDQLGRGPLPPVVGETTKYWIFVRANNTTNPVRNAAFHTTLAPGVSFTGKKSVTIGPSLSYDANSNSVSWSYAELPPFSQTGLYFEVAVTPSPDQIGKTLSLTGPISFTATDSVVNKEFKLSSPSLTNVLPQNDRGSSKGTKVVTE